MRLIPLLFGCVCLAVACGEGGDAVDLSPPYNSEINVEEL